LFESFDATDAAFRMGCVLYNLLAQFRETVLPRSWFERRLRAVRDLIFLVGADLISQGRRIKIRFAMPEPERPEFLRRLRTMSEGLPIAAQLEWSLTDRVPNHPDKIVTPIPLLSPHSTVDQSPRYFDCGIQVHRFKSDQNSTVQEAEGFAEIILNFEFCQLCVLGVSAI